MRYAMRDMIKCPPAGFEAAAAAHFRRVNESVNSLISPFIHQAAVAAHFRRVRPLLLKQTARWLSEARARAARPPTRASRERHESCWRTARALLSRAGRETAASIHAPSHRPSGERVCKAPDGEGLPWSSRAAGSLVGGGLVSW